MCQAFFTLNHSRQPVLLFTFARLVSMSRTNAQQFPYLHSETRHEGDCHERAITPRRLTWLQYSIVHVVPAWLPHTCLSANTQTLRPKYDVVLQAGAVQVLDMEPPQFFFCGLSRYSFFG